MMRPGEAIGVAGAAVKRAGRERQAAVLGLIQSGVGDGTVRYSQIREVEVDGVSSTSREIVVCSFGILDAGLSWLSRKYPPG